MSYQGWQETQERLDPPVTTRTATAAGDEDDPRARLVRLLARRAEAQALAVRLGDWILSPEDASRLLSAIDDQEGEGCLMTTVAEANVLWPVPYVASPDRHEALWAAIHARHVALRVRLWRLAGESPRDWAGDNV